jgi:hypothetical protein
MTHYNTLALTIFAAVFVAGCYRSNAVARPRPGGWTQGDLVNKCLVYERADGADKSRYNSDGTIAVTILTDGQPPVAPLFYWTIDSDGYLLESPFDDMSDARKTRLVKREGSTLSVARGDGTTYTLKYSE